MPKQLRQIKDFARRPWREQMGTVEAAVFLMSAVFLTKFVRLSYWRSKLGQLGNEERADQSADHAADHVQAAKVSKYVRRAARHMPFNAVCLPRALATCWMLKRRGISSELFIGARGSTNNGIDLHAWLTVGTKCVMGAEEKAAFAVLKQANARSDSST